MINSYRKLKSPIWTVTNENLQEIFNTSSTKIEVLKKLGLKSSSGSNSVLNLRIQKDNICLIKFNENNKIYLKELNVKLTEINKSKSKSRIENGVILLTSPKNFIIRNKLLDYKCQECGITDIYNNKKIILHLDHINGNHHDNTLTNLRFLCPNCHSQTSTYCSKKLIKPIIKQNNKYIKPTKIVWPSPEELLILIDKYPATIISSMLGVSSKAIEKHCKKYSIKMKPRGYWTKQKYL